MCWETGIDVYTTMKLAGHKSIKTTMDIYTHLSKAQFDRVAVQVNAMFSGKKRRKMEQTKVTSAEKVAQKLHKPTSHPPS